MKRKVISSLILSLIIGAGSLNAQINELGKFLAGSASDAESLFEGYLGPYFNAFGASLTGGWYNTAKPHQLGGFDLTATINTARVPTEDETFDLSKLGLSSFQVASNSDDLTSTIAGPKGTASTLQYADGLLEGENAFTMPEGTGWKSIPSPMLQLGVGLIKDTEIKGRYMPTYNYKDASMGMWGIGVVHGLKQYIPFIKRVPVLHLSLQYGYTQLNSSMGMNTTPEHLNAVWAGSGAEPVWDDQEMSFVTNSHTANLLFSANLPVVCFYGGVGFASTKSELKLSGDFPVVDLEQSIGQPKPVVTESSVLNNPLSMEVKNTDGSTTKPRYNAGMRFKFAVITLHFDYTYANYSMFTGGLGISFR